MRVPHLINRNLGEGPSPKFIGARERKNAFGQKAKFAFEKRVRASWEPSFLLMPMPSVPDFSWYKKFTRLLPHLVQSFGTNFVLPTRLYGTIFFWYIFSGTISFSGTKTFGFAFGLRSPICVRSTRSAISHLRSRTPI